jgi:hypothetical protein
MLKAMERKYGTSAQCFYCIRDGKTYRHVPPLPPPSPPVTPSPTPAAPPQSLPDVATYRAPEQLALLPLPAPTPRQPKR